MKRHSLYTEMTSMVCINIEILWHVSTLRKWEILIKGFIGFTIGFKWHNNEDINLDRLKYRHKAKR